MTGEVSIWWLRWRGEAVGVVEEWSGEEMRCSSGKVTRQGIEREGFGVVSDRRGARES